MTERKRALHLAIVQPRWRPDGGVERFVARAVDALADYDLRITVVSRKWRPGTTHRERHVVCNPFYLGRTWNEWSFGRSASRVIAEIKPDCVHSHVRMDQCDVFRAGGGVHAEWLRQRGRSIGALRRFSIEVSPYHRYVLRAERRLYTSGRIGMVVCNSHMVRDEIIEHYDTPPEKLRVIHNAVDREYFKPDESDESRRRLRHELGLKGDAVVFLFNGSGFGRKGMPVLLRALARVRPEAHLLVLGRDTSMRAYRRAARGLGVADRVHWAGVVKQPLRYIQGADAFVLPTLYDPFSNAVLEALSVGLPVLTSFKCGAVDFIRDGENGFICDALDVDGVASRMTLLLDARTRARVGAAGREATSHLTLESMAEQLFSVYEQVAGRGPRSAARRG